MGVTRYRGKQKAITPVAVSCELPVGNYSSNITKKIVYECPKCHTKLLGYSYAQELFCHHCGKALDWTRTIEGVTDTLFIAVMKQFPLNDTGVFSAQMEMASIVNRCARDGNFSTDSSDIQFVAACIKTLMYKNEKKEASV